MAIYQAVESEERKLFLKLKYNNEKGRSFFFSESNLHNMASPIIAIYLHPTTILKKLHTHTPQNLFLKQ